MRNKIDRWSEWKDGFNWHIGESLPHEFWAKSVANTTRLYIGRSIENDLHHHLYGIMNAQTQWERLRLRFNEK